MSPRCSPLVAGISLFLLAFDDRASAGDSQCSAIKEDGTCNSSPIDDATRSTASSSTLECGVYMAPSTIGNYTNLGIFTGKALQPGQVVNYPEIAIPILWRDWDEHPPYAHGDGELWDRYIWEGEVAGIEAYDDLDRGQHRAVFVPGVGCTVNSMLDLKNIQSTSGSIYEPLVERKHPAAGAFTPYHSSKTIALENIPEGSELFAGYGESWIPWIPDAAITQSKYLDAADEFLSDFAKFAESLQQRYPNELSIPLLKRIWEMVRRFPRPARELSVLPDEMDWNALLSRSSSPSSSSPSTRDYWRTRGRKSIEWLQQNGKCQDHLRPGLSTIPHAGRGAFAARNLHQGTVVGYAPLVHVGERAIQLWTIQYNHTSLPKKYSKPDIVLNYSFGHKDSTLVLTPYGAVVNYINHSKERANVKVQWPTEELVAHKSEWLNKDVAFLRDTTNKIGLSFDYVALRDIEEGEEIFMDYGDEWQQAWDKHVRDWQPPGDAAAYVHSSDYALEKLKTPSEQLSTPYPPNLHTLCINSYTKDGLGRFVFAPVLRKDTKRVYCEVLERSHDDASRNYYYTVKLQISEATDEMITVHKVTRPDGIDLYDKVFSQDWHLPHTFRHKIYVPDDVFPENWKNLKQQSKETSPRRPPTVNAVPTSKTSARPSTVKSSSWPSSIAEASEVS